MTIALTKDDWLNTKESATDLLRQHTIGNRINSLIIDLCNEEIKQIEEIECLECDNVLNSANKDNKDNKSSKKK